LQKQPEFRSYPQQKENIRQNPEKGNTGFHPAKEETRQSPESRKATGNKEFRERYFRVSFI